VWGGYTGGSNDHIPVPTPQVGAGCLNVAAAFPWEVVHSGRGGEWGLQ